MTTQKHPVSIRMLPALLGLLVSVSTVWAAPAINVIISTPDATYKLNGRVPITIEVRNSTPKAAGNDSAANDAANASNTARGFRVNTFTLSGRDIYGNAVDVVLPGTGIGDLGPEESQTKTYDFVIPNDGTLHDVSEPGYQFVGNYSYTDPVAGLQTGNAATSPNVLIDVIPDLALEKIDFTPGSYRGGDVIRLTATIRNLPFGEGVRQGRPLTNVDDQFRFDARLSIPPAFGPDTPEARANQFELYYGDFAGDLGSALGSVGFTPGGGSVIREVRVVNTPQPPPGYGVLLTATATITTGAGGQVVSLAVVDGGRGFTSGDAILIQGAQITGGVPFEGTATVTAGRLTSVAVTTAGEGYLPNTIQTVTLINANGRNYNPQPYDGFLDLGEAIEVVIEVRLPDNFPEVYYVTGQVDSLGTLVEPRPTENLVPYPDTVDGAGADKLVNNNTFVSRRATRIILQAGANASTSLLSDGSTPAGASVGADNFSDFAVVSGSGEWVAFLSAAKNLLGASGQTTNGRKQIFARQPSTGQTLLVSASNAGTQGNRDSSNPAISADGRFVAFASESTNLAGGDMNNASDIFVRDLTGASDLSFRGSLVRVSVNADGTEGNGGSFNPSLSDNGRFVAFESTARNLDKNRRLPSTAGSTLVYVHNRSVDGKLPYDRPGNTSTRLASIDFAGRPANGLSSFARISGDGSTVAFSSYAPNLNSGASKVQQVYRISLANGEPVAATLVLVSQTTAGQPGNAQSYQPSINRNGTQIAFASDADLLVAGDTNGVADVFVRDLSAGRTSRVSVSNPRRAWGTITFVSPLPQRGLAPTNNPARNSRVTVSDGVRTVAFVFGRTAAETATTRNVPIGLNGGQTRDNLLQAIRLSSLDVDAYSSTPPPSGADFLKAPYSPSIYIAAITPGAASNKAITTDSAVLFVTGMAGGGTEAADPDALVGEAPAGSITPSISADGRFIAFRSVASNLVVFEQASGQVAQGLKNGDLLRPQLGAFSDIYVHDRRKSGTGAFDRRGNVSTELISVSTFGNNTGALLDVQSSGNNQLPALSADGQFVAFSSDAENAAGLSFGASNLVPLDNNGHRDVYLRNRNLGGSQSPLPPENLPLISFTSPVQNGISFVTGTTVPLAVDVGASAGKTITQVQYTVNGAPLITLTEAPYFTTYRFSAPGTYKIVATVTDSFNIQTQTFVTVTAAAPIVQAPSLSVTHPTPGGAGDVVNDFSDASSFYLNALAIAAPGSFIDFVLGANVDAGGSGYTKAPRVTLAGGGGSGATAVARISQGRVVGVDIVNSGQGYSSAPSVRFSGGGGMGARATAFLNKPFFFANGELLGNTVGEIRVFSGGTGYTTAPEVRVVGGGGSGVQARALVSGGKVTAVRIFDGGRSFSTPPSVRFVGGGGTGARASAFLTAPVERLGDQYGIFWRPESAGNVQITAQVTDSRGNTVVSTPLEFTMDPVIRPLPTIKMKETDKTVAPKAGSQILLEASYRANSLTLVSRVDFYANQVYIGAWEPSTSLEDSEGVASAVWIPERAGTYQISARVMQVLAEPGDNSVVSSNKVKLTVQPELPSAGSPPVVLLTDPVSEPRLARGSAVYLNVTATDPDGTIADKGVKIFIDGQEQSGVRRYGDTWSVLWRPTENGTYFVTASAVDNNGNAVAFPRTQFEVAQALSPLPQVRFDQVVGGSTLSQNSPVTLRAAARFFGNQAAPRVDFYANGALLGTGLPDASVGSDGFRGYSLVWTPPSTGRDLRFSVKAVSVNYTTGADNDNTITTYGAVVSAESSTFNINGISGATQNQRFVRDIYPILLGRVATYKEWEYFVKQLEAKRMDQADVVLTIMDYKPGMQLFGYDAEYGRTKAMVFATYGRLGLTPNNNLVQAFLSTLSSDITPLPLTDYPPLAGAPYGATQGLATATQEVMLSSAFARKYPTELSLSDRDYLIWLRDRVFPQRPLGDLERLISLMNALPTVRQGAAMAFLSRLVDVSPVDPEKLFQRQISSTALQFMLSGGKAWSVKFGVDNPYTKTVVVNLLKKYPVGVAAAPVARTTAGAKIAGSYHGTVNRARLNANSGGSVSLQVTAKGVATGTISMNGRVLDLRGVVGPDGKITAVTVPVPGQPGYRVDLQLENVGKSNARITGSIKSGNNIATLSAKISPWGAGKTAAAYAGTYNVRFSEVPASAKKNPAVPAGIRKMQVEVKPSGVVNVASRLANGVPFSWSGRLAGDGSIMLHVDIPNRGSLMGRILLKKAKPSSKVMTPSGSLVWQSPKQGTKAAFRAVLAVQSL